MSKANVVVEGLSKKFGLSLQTALKYGLLDSTRRMLGRASNHDLRAGEFWALRDIDFSLEPGDALEIMGVNGSGKTTLLRILNGTYSPDVGKVTMRGQIGALIAAGAGFSPMLSGRENIYISGALLGMTPAEIRRRFDDIVAFAELDEFLDMPIRNYSSGMNVRLGFAIAVINTPEILLVDEVLAVGDISFQKKCFERIQQLRNQGTTILLVSHSPGAIWSVCNKGLLINKGRSEGIVSVEDACRAYDHVNMQSRAASSSPRASDDDLPVEYGGMRGGTGDVIVTKLELLDEFGRVTSEVGFGKSFVLRHHVDVRKPLDEVIFRVQVDAEINKSIAILDSYEAHGRFYTLTPGKHVIDVKVTEPNLRPGLYSFCPSLVRKPVGVHLFFQYGMGQLVVKHPTDTFLYADFRASAHLRTSFHAKLQQDDAPHDAKDDSAASRSGQGSLNLVVGSGSQKYDGWISTDLAELNIVEDASWSWRFAPNSLERVLAEHVLEHLTLLQLQDALWNIYKYLKPGGRFRLAVPDAFHPSGYYYNLVKPGGWETPFEHFLFIDYEMIGRLGAKAGFEVHLLEYFDEAGIFHCTDYRDEDGVILRRARNNAGLDTGNAEVMEKFYSSIPANLRQQFFDRGMTYTSLIVDLVKPL